MNLSMRKSIALVAFFGVFLGASLFTGAQPAHAVCGQDTEPTPATIMSVDSVALDSAQNILTVVATVAPGSQCYNGQYPFFRAHILSKVEGTNLASSAHTYTAPYIVTDTNTVNVSTLGNGTHTLGIYAYGPSFEGPDIEYVDFTINRPQPTPAPFVNIKADGDNGPLSIPSGSSATLTWYTENADTCSASWDSQNPTRNVQNNSGESTGPITSSKTFILTCSGPGGTKSDSVKVNPTNSGGTIIVKSVDRDLPTTWQITGSPVGVIQSPGYPAPVLDATYSNQQGEITYTIVPQPKSGYSVRVFPECNPACPNVPGSVQTLPQGGEVVFNIDYAYVPNRTLRLTPSSTSTPIGGTRGFTALYDPDGLVGPQAEQNVSTNVTWGVSPANIATFVNTAGNRGNVRGDAVGTATVVASYQGLSASAQLAVTSGQGTPPPNPPAGNSPYVVVSPSSEDCNPGSTVYFQSLYDADGGNGPQTEQNVSTAATWNVSNGNVATFMGTANGSAAIRCNNPGTVTVTATFQGLSDDAVVNVSQPSGALSVNFLANPNQGSAPLLTSLVADVGGTATGPITYYFWWHCSYTGNSIPLANHYCGNAGLPEFGARFNNINEDPKSVSHTYSNAGIYTPKVIVARDGYSAQSRVGVTVQAAPSGTHRACVANACVQVPGAGPNTCSVNADCANPPTPPNPPGPGDPNSPQDLSHLQCIANSCVRVQGPGQNSCFSEGAACGLPGGPGAPGGPGGPGRPVSCTFTASPDLISRGGTSVLAWDCNDAATSCSVTDNVGGGLVASGAPDGSVNVSPAVTTPYSLSCNSGAFTDDVTVRVLSINEVPPR